MPIRNPADIKRDLPRGQRLLGLDVGEKTIGLAVCDPSMTIASPEQTLRRGKRFRDDAALLKEVIERRGIGALVIGLPINMDGSEGPRCQSMRQFAENVLSHMDIDIAFWDERLSTAAVTRTMLDADLSRRRRAELVDKLAAAYILQGFLDAMATTARAS